MAKLDMTLEAIRELSGASELLGDPAFHCRAVASLESARADELSFVRDQRYLDRARRSNAGALLVPAPLDGYTGHQLVAADPFMAFARVLAHIARETRRQPPGVHPSAVVSGSAVLGEGVSVGPGTVVSDGTAIGARSVLYANVFVGAGCELGEDVVLYPGVVLMENIRVGSRVVIHGGSVIGAEGYGYVQHRGRHVKVPQVGEIEIGDDVEIGALATVDRATVDRTTIGRGTKIGDLVHIAHNCTIGEDALILPTVAISGSVRIGDRALLAGRAGTVDNISIGDDAILGATAVAIKDVPDGAAMWGNPARPKGLQLRIEAALARLPQMQHDLRALKKKLED